MCNFCLHFNVVSNCMDLFCALFQWQVNRVLLDGGVQISFFFDTSVWGHEVNWGRELAQLNTGFWHPLHWQKNANQCKASGKRVEQPLSNAVPASARLGPQDDDLWATEQIPHQFFDAEGKRPDWCLLPCSCLHGLWYMVLPILLLIRLFHKLIKLATLSETYPQFWFFAWSFFCHFGALRKVLKQPHYCVGFFRNCRNRQPWEKLRVWRQMDSLLLWAVLCYVCILWFVEWWYYSLSISFGDLCSFLSTN